MTAVKTRHALWCFVSLVPRPTTSPPDDLVETTKYWMFEELEWEDSQKSRVEEHATNNDTTKLRRDDGGGPKRGALHGSHNAVLPYRVKVCFYCVNSLTVLSSGSTVGVKTDALVVALFQNCSFHGVLCCCFFRCKQTIWLRLLCGSADVASRSY